MGLVKQSVEATCQPVKYFPIEFIEWTHRSAIVEGSVDYPGVLAAERVSPRSIFRINSLSGHIGELLLKGQSIVLEFWRRVTIKRSGELSGIATGDTVTAGAITSKCH
jgi:hypothetical protein